MARYHLLAGTSEGETVEVDLEPTMPRPRSRG